MVKQLPVTRDISANAKTIRRALDVAIFKTWLTSASCLPFSLKLLEANTIISFYVPATISPKKQTPLHGSGHRCSDKAVQPVVIWLVGTRFPFVILS